jgi:malonate-semialdehyde dehydrogenase (acetylating)/methylmalonate-semialdehyde dehydrogenase
MKVLQGTDFWARKRNAAKREREVLAHFFRQSRLLVGLVHSSKTSLNMADLPKINNWINDEFVVPHGGQYLPVGAPLTGEPQAQVALSDKADVDAAVAASKAAFLKWRDLTVKARAAILFKIHHLIEEHKDELATLIMKEHGKTKAEALAEVAKANETVEYATSMPQLLSGRIQEVSRGVFCTDRRDPLGTCVCVWFHFPYSFFRCSQL